jgi:hypothetical protein
VKGEAGSDVQQPVTQALGLAGRQLAGQQQALGPDDQVMRDPDERQPDAVVLEVAKRQVSQPGVLVVSDVRFGVRTLALATLEHLDVGVGLVGQDTLEAVAVVVGERQLCAGMRALAPDDHPRPGWPPRQIQGRCDLGDLPVLTLAAVARKRCDPRVLGDVEDRGANRVSQLVADRVAQPMLETEVQQLMRRARRVRTHQDLDRLDQLSRDLRERVLDDRDVIAGGVRARVAGAQDRSERLAGFVAVGHQRVKAVAALVVAGSALLLRMTAHQGRVDLDRDPLGRPRQLPDMLARTGMRIGERVKQPRRRRDPVHNAKRGRVRRDRPEQRVLVTQRADVGEAVSAVGEHHREIADHAAGIVPGPARLQALQAHRQRLREPTLIGDLRKQRAARVRYEPFSVRRDFYRDVAAIALHPQGDPPELGPSASATRRIPAQPDVPALRLRSERPPCCKIRASSPHRSR